jgi:hypothetical protein
MDHDPLPSRSTVIARSVRLQGIPILRAVLGARMSHLGSFASVGPRIADIRTTPHQRISSDRPGRLVPVSEVASRYEPSSPPRPVAMVSQIGGFRPSPDEQIATNAPQLSPYGCHHSKNLVGYLGVAGMAEEWWSTISQRSPFLT